MPCVRTQHLVLAGIELTIIWAINSADDKFVIFFFFITEKTGFDISCNGDNLHETQILFSWKNEKNISKCRLLKILPSAKRYGLHKQITHESVHGKTYDKTCTKRRISLHMHSDPAHQ